MFHLLFVAYNIKICKNCIPQNEKVNVLLSQSQKLGVITRKYNTFTHLESY